MVSATAAGPREERALVERAVARDKDAFAELYDRHAPPVYRRLYKLVGNQGDAEDLTAQSFLQAWQAIDRFEVRGAPFLAWLHRIAHNLAVSHLRRRRDHAPLPEALSEAGPLRTDPEQAVQHLIDHEHTVVALRGLGREQRLVIVLRILQDRDYAEVAEIMGKSVPTVRVLRHRAVNALRRQMELQGPVRAVDARPASLHPGQPLPPGRMC
jgi:RNA polymerase sigma-70 factor (ECF subfamily)